MKPSDLIINDMSITRVHLAGAGQWKLYVEIGDFQFHGYFDSMRAFADTFADLIVHYGEEFGFVEKKVSGSPQ